jgi:hypothetical protein
VNSILAILNNKWILFLKSTLTNNEFIFYSTVEWNPDKISKTDLFRGIQLGLEMAMMEPMTQVNGVVFIEDLGDLSFSHIFEISPSYTAMTMDFVS